uniref:DUF3615 domain-containing protein n=1 Tax=Oryza punctata TaxID=4537 RepID=A0A0E0L592_ORYPU
MLAVALRERRVPASSRRVTFRWGGEAVLAPTTARRAAAFRWGWGGGGAVPGRIGNLRAGQHMNQIKKRKMKKGCKLKMRNATILQLLTEKTGPPKQNTDCTAAAQRQSNNYAKTALEHYNKDENNKTQYRLIKALKSCAIQTNESYGHVNFVASSSDSKEEFFFAEVCYDPESNGLVPTCMVSLEENNRIGGLLGIGFVGCPDLLNPPIDDNHCYACDDSVKHPIDGTLFNAGHVAATGFYTSF